MTDAARREDSAEIGWAILELMGHRRLAGYVREQEIAGKDMLRIDVPDPGAGSDAVATQFYSPQALYCLTPTTEAVARATAARARPEPVTRWELERGADRDEQDIPEAEVW